MSCKTSSDYMAMSVCGSVGCFCFLVSAASMFGYIYTAGNKRYEFLGEVSIYAVLLSFLFMVITSNIRDEYRRSPSKPKSTKVTPVDTTDDFP
jgi:hypothetical protein